MIKLTLQIRLQGEVFNCFDDSLFKCFFSKSPGIISSTWGVSGEPGPPAISLMCDLGHVS